MGHVEDVMTIVKEMTLIELRDLNNAIEEEFGVTAAAPVAAVAAAPVDGGGGDAADEDNLTVTLANFGEKKIDVIKAVRSVTDLGLKEAKEFVESAPGVVKDGLNKEEANSIKEQLEAAGASVEVK
ncbi:MAG TPA: 50S ribosomal protein L7/L12 [Dehalococcoidia bacterium]|jgi:large subunit ribosomal protein L7/L12|nr:50S ribosomal protein L7/L12 [Dehalococcoidia bacterium]